MNDDTLMKKALLNNEQIPTDKKIVNRQNGITSGLQSVLFQKNN